MANEKHLAILNQGVDAWNKWRKENPEIEPDLSEAKLSKKDLFEANFNGADLLEANLSQADLSNKAKLIGANLSGADLCDADLSDANLSEAKLIEAKLIRTVLMKANLSGVYLLRASLVETNFEKAKLTGCHVYGISAWDLELEGAEQSNLIITPPDEPTITVDDLEVAQFIYLLLNNKKIRHVIDTITSKAVLILGRFTPERKAVLDAIREELRKHNYLPILFDFEKPATRDTQETINTLAGLVRFIIADITDPKSIPQELVSVVEKLPSVPVQPLLKLGSEQWGMYDHIKRYHSVLPIYYYDTLNDLIASLGEKAITLADTKAKELQKG
jgi:uncharacterized protein YjbI with pentapeptide repeats